MEESTERLGVFSPNPERQKVGLSEKQPIPLSGSSRRKRQRGAIATFPSGSMRVRVYAGIGPLSGKRHDLVEVITAAKDAGELAEQARPHRFTSSPPPPVA